jgi:uncharacterized protein (DUF2336 family)
MSMLALFRAPCVPRGCAGIRRKSSRMEKRRHKDRRTRPAESRAIAGTGSAEAGLAVLANPCAGETGREGLALTEGLAPSAITRIATRFGHIGAIRDALFARPDLPAVVRLSLVRQLSGALAGFVAGRGWLPRGRAEQMEREACEKAAVAVAAFYPDHDIRPLIRHLQMNGQLTVELTLRALLSGHTAMFEGALAERAGLPLRSVQALVRDGGGGLRAVFDKAGFDRAGLPASACAALRDTLTAAGRMRRNGECDGGRLERRLIELALVEVARSGASDRAPLIAVLRRFAAESARENPAANGRASPGWARDAGQTRAVKILAHDAA